MCLGEGAKEDQIKILSGWSCTHIKTRWHVDWLLFLPELPAAVTPLKHVAVPGSWKADNKQVTCREVATPVKLSIREKEREEEEACQLRCWRQKLNN